MPVARLKLFSLLVVASVLFFSVAIHADDSAPIFPLKDVKPGMKGVAYTIFTGDTVEKVDLVVIGVLENALGPKQDIILVQLLGEKAEHTGVVAGMSGSPVYFDGKLAGALSLKLGVFNKEAIGGVTPIENMLSVNDAPVLPAAGARAAATNAGELQYTARVPLPQNFATQTESGAGAGAGEFLIPIETPLIAT